MDGGERPRDAAIDQLTLIAIALVAYAAANVLHEGLGHGGACLLVHGRPMVWSAVHFECDLAGRGPTAARIVAAGGTVVNLVASAIAWWWLVHRPSRSPHLRFALWLFATINLLQGTGYFLFSGVAHVGDWVEVMQGLMPEAAWRVLLAVVGGSTYWMATLFAIHRLDPFLPRQQPARYRRGARLCWTPYLSGGVLYCVAGLLNPVGMVLVGISAAAASLGGTSGLAWGSQYLHAPAPAGATDSAPLPLFRSRAWIVAGGVSAAVFVCWLGPGVRLG